MTAGARLLGAVLATGLAMTGLAACGADHRVAVGAVVPAADAVTGTAVSVLVPTGDVAVTLGDPVGSVTKEDTKRLKDVSPPDGGSFVPVSMSWDFGEAPWGSTLSAKPRSAEVSLVIGGTTYPVGSPYSVGDNGAMGDNPDNDVYVAVPGHPARSAITAQVSYDGVAQTIAADGTVDRGRAEGLYGLDASLPGNGVCPSKGWTSSDPRLRTLVDCGLSIAGRTPYYPGLGWAATGHEWVVVNARVSLVQAELGNGGRTDVYRVAGATDHTTLAGAAPRSPMQDAASPSEATVSGSLVFDRPAGAPAVLHLDVAYRLRLAGGTAAIAPLMRSVTVTRTVTLG